MHDYWPRSTASRAHDSSVQALPLHHTKPTELVLVPVNDAKHCREREGEGGWGGGGGGGAGEGGGKHGSQPMWAVSFSCWLMDGPS